MRQVESQVRWAYYLPTTFRTFVPMQVLFTHRHRLVQIGSWSCKSCILFCPPPHIDRKLFSFCFTSSAPNCSRAIYSIITSMTFSWASLFRYDTAWILHKHSGNLPLKYWRGGGRQADDRGSVSGMTRYSTTFSPFLGPIQPRDGGS
jgi:hypothetical protein